MSRTETRTLPDWAKALRRLREQLNLSQEGLARRIDLSVSEIRRWDQGLRAPSASWAITLGRMAGPPDCWIFWELAGIRQQDVLDSIGAEVRRPRAARKSKRVSQETQEAALSALELIFDRAPSTVIEQTVEFLITRAGKYGENK